MLDPKLLRTQPEIVAKTLKTRGFILDVEKLQTWEIARKNLQTETQQLQNTRNEKSKEIGKLKSQGHDIESLKAEMSSLGDILAEKEEALAKVQAQWDDYCLRVPNIPDADVPIGKTEAENVELRRWGEPKIFDFQAKDHVDLGLLHHGIDLESGAALSGSRFVVLKGEMARLHRALTQFMLDTHLEEHGYQEAYVPYLVHSDCLVGTSQLPKFKEDQFGVTDSDLWLIPTAEVSLTNLCREKVLNISELPQQWVAHTPCFRKEAGSYGKDIRGMFRVHQFDKVELVQIVKPEASELALETLTHHAEVILQKLELPYRVVSLCTGDMGFGAAKTYDLEVWLPGQNKYREISSCSNFRDFQARRMHTRFRHPDTQKNEYVHTLNGSGLAVGRTFIAVLENYQNSEGEIEIPQVLKRYMGDREKLFL